MKMLCKKHGLQDLVFFADKEVIKQHCEICCSEFLEKIKPRKFTGEKINLRKNKSKEVQIIYKNRR